MGNWSISTPAGSDLLSLGDDTIRAGKAAIQEALRAGEVAGDDIEGVEAIFPGASPSTAPVYRYRGLKDTTANRPTAGQYGLYFDTTRNVLQRDNGSTWDDVATVIPSGTKMVFYQASAPVGWTAVAVNDKFLRVVTSGGTGGSTGGSGLTPSSTITLAHIHTVAAHTHDLANHTHTGPSHTHSVPRDGWGSSGVSQSGRISVTSSTTANNDNTTGSGGTGATSAPSTNTSGSSSPSVDSQLSDTSFQYADVVVASKD